MDTQLLPTKQNLLLARNRLNLARKGFDLLERKRQVLLNELTIIRGKIIDLRDEANLSLCNAYHAFKISAAEIGIEKTENIINGSCVKLPGNEPFGIRKIMGVELSVVNDGYIFPLIGYGLSDTTILLDEAVLAWKEARQLIISWLALENTVKKLLFAIKKTEKRANALGNITIPKYETLVKTIKEQLEERERDELARLKLAKNAPTTANT